jgi:two-component system, OmpR family, phosphate regulon response regulator PhoB
LNRKSRKYHQIVPGKRGTVLVVDDSAESTELVTALVEREGFHVVACDTAEAGLAAFGRERPVAILLDWVLPDGPGTEVCRAIRAQDPTVIIIFVSGREDETSVVRGLDAGADDYLSKPVRGGELVARLEANLRKVAAARAGAGPTAPDGVPASLRFGKVTVDFGAHEVWVGEERVRLGPLEFKLLEYLARNSGVAVSREQVMNEVYGYDADISTERVDLLVRRLRAKIGDEDGGYIAAVPGFGYRLERRSLR